MSSRKLKFQPERRNKSVLGCFILSVKKEPSVKSAFSLHMKARGREAIRSSVLHPFNRWKNALETFQGHDDCEYHKAAVLYAANFIKAIEGRLLLSRLTPVFGNNGRLAARNWDP